MSRREAAGHKSTATHEPISARFIVSRSPLDISTSVWTNQSSAQLSRATFLTFGNNEGTHFRPRANCQSGRPSCSKAAE